MPPTEPTRAATLLRVGLVLLTAALLAVGGCRGRTSLGALRVESLGADPVVLGSDYRTAVYTHTTGGDTYFVLSDVPLHALLDGSVRNGQVMHIELLWEPKAGATPMDWTATNASIRHVIFANGEVGIYGGAGFAIPDRKVGAKTIRMSMRDATVRLLESTGDFVDPLSPARLTGTFAAKLDPTLTRKLHRATSQIVTNAIRHSRLVRGSAGANRTLAAR